MNKITSLHDMHKLNMLPSAEKYIANISQKDGSATFFRVTDSQRQNLFPENNLGDTAQYRPLKKTYSLEEIRLKYPRAYESWSESEDRELIEQYKQGMSVYDITKIHQRQRSGIKSRIRKMQKIGLIE